MPTYTIDYAFDCSCYGSREIEADSPEHAAEIARELHLKDELVCGDWKAAPETGTDNNRVVQILDENSETVDDGFDLPTTDTKFYDYLLIHEWGGQFTTYRFRCPMEHLSTFYLEDELMPDDIAKIMQVLEIDFEPENGESISITQDDEQHTICASCFT
jgi:hypothetical protein